MVGSSVEVWQEIQPEDLRSASSCDWSRNAADACGTFAGGFELAQIAKTKDNAEMQRTHRVRSEEGADWRALFVIGASQKVNFTEPKSDNSVRLV
jgi:hypothetical protein